MFQKTDKEQKASVRAVQEDIEQPFCVAEYSVYVFHAEPSVSGRHRNWELKHVTKDVNKALARAKILNRCPDYGRVEVKKKIYDADTQQCFDLTYKVYEGAEEKRDLRVPVLAACAVIGLALMACLVFFFV